MSSHPATDGGDLPFAVTSVFNAPTPNSSSKKRRHISSPSVKDTPSCVPPSNPNKRLNTGRRRRPRVIPKFKLIHLTFKGKKPRLSGPDRRRIKGGGNGNLTVMERVFLSLPAYKRNRYKMATAIDMVKALGLSLPKDAKKQDILEFLMDRLIEKENGQEFMTLIRPPECCSASGSTEDDDDDETDDDDTDADGEEEGDVENAVDTHPDHRAGCRGDTEESNKAPYGMRLSESVKPHSASPGTIHHDIATKALPASTIIGPDSQAGVCNLGPVLDHTAAAIDGYKSDSESIHGKPYRRVVPRPTTEPKPKMLFSQRMYPTTCWTSNEPSPSMSSRESIAAAAVAAAAKAATATMPSQVAAAATATMPSHMGHRRQLSLKLPPSKDKIDQSKATPPSTQTMEHWRLGLTPTKLIQFRLPTVSVPITPLCGTTMPLTPSSSMLSITPNTSQTQDKFTFPPDLFMDDCDATAC